MKYGLVLLLALTAWTYRSVRTADFVYEDRGDRGEAPVFAQPWRGTHLELHALQTHAIAVDPGAGWDQAPWTWKQLARVNPRVLTPHMQNWQRELVTTWQDGLPKPRSLTTLSDRLQAGHSAGAYHLGNLSVHLVNGVLVYAVLAPLSGGGALLGAALWLLHPMQHESVAYVSGRGDLLVVTAILLMLLALRVPGRVGVACVTLCAGLAVLAKESGVVALGLLPLWAAYQGVSLRRFWPMGLASGGLAIWAAWTLLPVPASGLPPPHGPVFYAAVQAAATLRLAALLVWPVGFTISHDFDRVGLVLAIAALLGTLTLLGLALRTSSRRLRFGVLWAGVALSPRFVIGLSEYLNEHQFSVACLGLVLALGAGETRAECRP